MAGTPPTESELLVAYVKRALEQQARGDTIDVAAICRDHPHLQAALADVLGLDAALPALQRAARATDPLAGQLLGGRYRLDDCLGRGAMGVVYRARDQELQRTVAVKILDARLFHDEVSAQRFQREAELLAALQHGNVVAVHDRGRTPEGILFLVMELLEGSSLAAILASVRGADDAMAALAALGVAATESTWLRQCARWTAELANGLEVAHGLGVVHRDVKPSNVFVTRAGTAKLLDFGIAARAGDDGRLTATATTLGTPWYMAPEQVGASGPPQPRQDVYSLCATLYHLATGRPPYDGDGAAVLAALQRHDPAPVRAVAPAVPRDLAAIVEKGMERAPHRRYGSAAQLAADLHAFLQHQPVVARPIGRFGRLLRATRRAPARAAALALAVLVPLLLAVGLPLWSQVRQRQRDEAYAAELATLPTLLAIEGKPDERPLAVLAPEHREGEAQLSRILDLRPDDLPMRMFRGALRIDLGDHDGAAADFAAIADSSGSPYLAALAARYLRADAAQAGALAVDVRDLPEPATAADRYVAAFHELRNRTDGYAARAVSLLRAAAAEYPPASDQLQMALLAAADGATGAQRLALFEEARDLSLRLEGVYGGPTARTLAVRGVALVAAGDYAAAVAPLEESLRLRPGRHAPLQNLGVALWRLARYAEAEERLLAAQRVRPFAWNTKFMLAQVKLAQLEFDRAQEYAESIDPRGGAGLDATQPELLGHIALRRALALRTTDVERAKVEAERAAAAYARAAAAPSVQQQEARRNRLLLSEQLAHAIRAGDREQAVVDYMNLSRGTTLDAYTIQNVAQLLPDDGLGPQGVWMLGLWLRGLAIARSGGDLALAQRLRAEIEALAQQPPR